MNAEILNVEQLEMHAAMVKGKGEIKGEISEFSVPDSFSKAPHTSCGLRRDPQRPSISILQYWANARSPGPADRDL
jgi:hypothetical protein